jgi:hypothetical protein
VSRKHEKPKAEPRRTDPVPTAEQSWARHAQVRDIIEDIRRVRAQRQPRPVTRAER